MINGGERGKKESADGPVDLRASPTDRSNLIGMECESASRAEMDRVIKAVTLQIRYFLERRECCAICSL